MQLSSSDTFYLKFIQPWLVGLILLWVFVDSCNSQTVNGLIVASVIAITMGLLALCGRLKKVFINTNGILTVSDFKRECQFDSKFCRNDPVNRIDICGLNDWCEAETWDILMNLRSQAQQGGMKWAWNQYMGSKEGTPLDFKYTNWKDTYIVEGTRYGADEFGNFVAGWVGEHAGGGVGVLGSMVGGFFFDWGAPCSKNPR